MGGRSEGDGMDVLIFWDGRWMVEGDGLNVGWFGLQTAIN
jgi:hypothetical protein